MFEPSTPRQELKLLCELGEKDFVISNCCGNDESTFRRLRNGRRPIGRTVAARLHNRLITVLEDKFGIPELTWGRPFDGLFARIRPVMALPTISQRRTPTQALLKDDLVLTTLRHPCSDESDDLAVINARAGQNIASALLFYCWAPHAEGVERKNAPKLAVSRADTAIRLLDRAQVICADQPDNSRELAAIKQRLAYAHYNRVALYSEFRAERVDVNGGFSTFSDEDVTLALELAGDAIYDFLNIVKPGHPIRRTLSESALSIASRTHQLALAGTAWAALIDAWPPALDLRNANSGIAAQLSKDSDMKWLIATVGCVYDESKFPSIEG